MKVIFTEVNGVLNTAEGIDQRGPDAIDQIAFAGFVDLVKKTGANIVITSSWRLHHQKMDVLRGQLTTAGIISNLIGVTPNLGGPGGDPSLRHKEIHHWLRDRTDVTSYVVLDTFYSADGVGAPFYFDVDERYGLEPETIADVEEYFTLH